MEQQNDLLDLCRLNMMDEHITDSPAPDKDTALTTINWKRRQIAARIQSAALDPEKLRAAKHERECRTREAEDSTKGEQ